MNKVLNDDEMFVGAMFGIYQYLNDRLDEIDNTTFTLKDDVVAGIYELVINQGYTWVWNVVGGNEDEVQSIVNDLGFGDDIFVNSDDEGAISMYLAYDVYDEEMEELYDNLCDRVKSIEGARKINVDVCVKKERTANL